MNRLKIPVALAALCCAGVPFIGSAQDPLTQDQLIIDATDEPSTPPRGRGPFPGSASPGHSPGLPIRLELRIPNGKLQSDGAVLVDFLITNVGTERVTLPVSVDCRREPTDMLTLWFSSDAIKDQYLIDQQTGRPVKLEMVPINAQLCGRGNDPQTFHVLNPNETIRVHASSPEINPGTHAFTGHAELLRIGHGTSEVAGTADAEPVTKTLSPR